MSAGLAVQRLVRAALLGIDGVTGVFDGPPPGQAAPYLVIGPDVTTDWSHKSGVGHEHRISVSAWDAGPGAARAKALAGRVEAALRGLAGESGGNRVVSAVFVRALVLVDAEGWSQAVVDFRVRTLAV